MMAQVIALPKSSPRVKKAKLKKEEKRPEWNDAISDLSIHRPSAQELERKRLMCKSKNAEIAKLALLKRDLNRLSKKNDSSFKEKEKTILLKTVLFEQDNKHCGSPRESPKKRTQTKNHSGAIKFHDQYLPVKFVGKPVVTPAPKTLSSGSDVPSSAVASPKLEKSCFSTPRSRRRQSPASCDSSPIRRIGRCANKLQSICSRSDSMANLNNQRLDNLVLILKKLSSALDALETKVSPTMDAEGDKPKMDSIGNVAAFNEQLLSEFCRLVNLFQTVTLQLDKERNLREELSLEVIRQGTLIEELSVELLQIECQHLSQTNAEEKEVSSRKNKRDNFGGPETCVMKKMREDKKMLENKSKSSEDGRSSYVTKGSTSLPDVLEKASSRFKPNCQTISSVERHPVDGNIVTAGSVSVTGDHQLRQRSNLAITVSTSRGPLMKVGEEMAAAIISTVCSSDRGEMRAKSLSNSTSLTYVVEDERSKTHPPPAIMLALPHQRDTRSFPFDSLKSSGKSSSSLVGEMNNPDFILLEMDASWLPDTNTLQRTSPSWSPTKPLLPSKKQQNMVTYKQWEDPLPPPPSREESPLDPNSTNVPTVGANCRSRTSTQNTSPLITDCQPPFSFDDSNPSMALDLFQESTDSSELSHAAEGDSNLVMSSSAEGDFASFSDTDTACDRRGCQVKDQHGDDIKRRLDMEELLSKLEALQTHYMSAHIKLQSLVDRSSTSSNSPLNSDVDANDVTNSADLLLSVRCDKNDTRERCQQNG